MSLTTPPASLEGLQDGIVKVGTAYLYSAPSVGARKVASFPSGTQRSFYALDDQWGWCWVGNDKYYVLLADFDILPKPDATDLSLHEALVFDDVAYYEQPAESARKLGVFSPESIRSFYFLDASKTWGWAWLGESKYYFPLDESRVAVLKGGEGTDSRLYEGIVTASSTELRVGPTGKAESVGSFAKGTTRTFYKWNDQWGWSWIGDEKRYVFLGDFDVLPRPDAHDTSLQWGYLGDSTEYYDAPSVHAGVLGSFSSETMREFYFLDSGCTWGWSWLGEDKLYFPLDGVEILPPNDASATQEFTVTVGSDKTYYSFPTSNSKAEGTIKSGASLVCKAWDASFSWVRCKVGGSWYYTTTEGLDLALSGDAADKTPLHLYFKEATAYYREPNVGNVQADGFLPADSMATAQPHDSLGVYYALKKDGETIYVKTAGPEIIPSKTAVGSQSRTGMALEKTPYYSAPTANSRVLGWFERGEKVTYCDYTDDGSWGHAVVGSRTVFFDASKVVPMTFTTKYDISFDRIVELQCAQNPGASPSDIRKYMDPGSFSPGTSAYYQFAVLSAYQGIPSFNLDLVLQNAGTLRGQGAAFATAAKMYDLNETYLVAHMILESGWGLSSLASGTYYDGSGFWYGSEWVSYPGYAPGTYYNFFGIGAYDSDPFRGGIKMAISQGWNSPSNAVIGSAKWISQNYIHSSWGQDTLYKMRWQPDYAVEHGVAGWHQYATDPGWAVKIAQLMGEVVTKSGSSPDFVYDVPSYS